MKKVSARMAVKDALREDAKARKPPNTGTQLGAPTADSFINFAQKLGIGADNALSTGSYGYNPITRNRILLEWIHRGSWLGGIAVDLVADDMTRAGVDFLDEMEPDDQERIEHEVNNLDLWTKIDEVIKWGRLYGGALGVMLIDGQDPKTPLRLETVSKDQFKGLLVLDRWMVEPSLEDLVTDYGPFLGLPKYYKVQSNAPALRGETIHYSRVAFRIEGIQLPYQQRLTENLWGISVLERLYDRMVAFDSASTGAAQLVYKCFLRTLKIKGLRDIIAAGGAPMTGLVTMVDTMRRFQNMEGVTVVDAEDEFDIQQTSAMTGLGDALLQFGQQLSGALQIPLVRLFGQSPAGLNSSGESDLRMYYDGINQQQNRHLRQGVVTCYKLIAQSQEVKLEDTFQLAFTGLWQMDEKEKSDVAKTNVETVTAAKDGGLIGTQTSLRELRQASRTTGVFTNITQEMIDAADDEILPPMPEMGLDPLTGLPSAAEPPAIPGEMTKLPGDETDGVRPGGKAKQVAASTGRRKFV